MPNRAWIAATLALVGVLTADVAAQDPGRSTERPLVIRGVSRGVTGAVIGKPIPMRQIQTPGAFPNAYRTVGLVPTDANGDVRTIPTVPPPGTVIATSAKNVPTAQEEPEFVGDGVFASERQALQPIHPVAGKAPPKLLSDVPEVLPTPGNWKGSYPAEGAPGHPGIVADEVSGPAPRLYFSAEYLLWWTKGDRSPVLVTTGPDTAVVPGALNDPGTSILQDGDLNHNTRSGGRFTVGWFLDDCAGKAIELSGFFLGSRSAKFDANSAQFPVLSRPFFDVINGVEDVELVSLPGFFTGRVSVNAPSQLWGLEANLICPWCCGCDWRINTLIGPRFLSLTDSLSITEDIRFQVGDPPFFQAGDRVQVRDSFATKNRFWGGQVGVEGRWLRGRWTVDGRAKVGLGVTDHELTINGTQTFLVGVNTDPRPGGLLALGSNIGTYRKTSFSVVPEVGMSVGYYATDWMRLSVGYNFLYWSSVVRPGDQVDRNLNPFLIPNFEPRGGVNTGVASPTVPFKTTDYWAQGITFGVEFNF